MERRQDQNVSFKSFVTVIIVVIVSGDIATCSDAMHVITKKELRYKNDKNST